MKRAAIAIVGVVLVTIAGCARGDGRTLRSPPPGATTPTTAALSPLAVDPGSTDSGGALDLTLVSSAFVEGAAMPIRLSCDGGNLSPPMSWRGLPPSTVELALVVTDPDAAGFVHWVVAGIDPGVTGLAEGAVPEAAAEAVNGASEIGWTGPCPPPGSPHRYVFTLYALEEPSGVEEGEPADAAIAKITQRAGVATTLSGTYQR